MPIVPIPTARPSVVAFDLDGTIWTPDMYMLWGGGAPFKPVSPVELHDSSGSPVRLLGVSGKVLDELKTLPEWEGVVTAWVSCTDEPSWAAECMAKFKTPSLSSLEDRIDLQMIYKADKRTHFQVRACEALTKRTFHNFNI